MDGAYPNLAEGGHLFSNSRNDVLKRRDMVSDLTADMRSTFQNIYADKFLAPPLVKQNHLTDVALLYGSSLMNSGKQIVHNEMNKYLSISELRYFFAIDTSYVKKKLMLLSFPFSHKDWSLKIMNNARLTPKFDINAPDLYIPLMGFLTYLLLGGFIAGLENKFSPEFLGNLASKGILWTFIELSIQKLTLFFISSSNISFLELVSYSGYKFASIALCIILRIIFNFTVYVLSVFYLGISTSFCVMNFLRSRMMYDDKNVNDLPQTSSYINIEYKRKIYFLFLTGLSHLFQMALLSNVSCPLLSYG